MEDEEIESGDELVHQQLLDKVQSFNKRSHVEQRTEGGGVASEYHLAPVDQDAQVSLESLLSGLGRTGKKSLLALKKRLSTVDERVQPLEPPLNKIQADRANRRAANQESCKEVGKWVPIVKRNREADHLSFPLQPDYVPPPSLQTKVESFTPSTELERTVAAILAGSENVEKEDQELTEAEKKSLLMMTVEEAMERKKALQKHRALVSYYEQKCRRIRRIKSKKFHKVQRKRLEKISGKGEVTDEEELMKLRAKERVTLKHSSKAKWAKKQRVREHRDPATQQALSEHHQRKFQLTQKVAEEETSDESGSEGENKEDAREDEEVDPIQSHDNPWFRSLDSTKSDAAIKVSSPRNKDMPASPNNGCIDTDSFMVESREREGGRGLKRASEQLLSIKEAFSGDNVVEEFQKEKEELEAKEIEKDTPVVLPGWGSWGGEGVRPPKKVAKVMRPHLPRKPRQDAGMKHVIISEHQRNKKLIDHMVKSVPWPYTSKEQFDKTHSTPVGRHWNTEATFHELIKPHVNTSIGEIIEPLEMTEDVQKYIKRSDIQKGEKKKKKERHTAANAT